MLGLIRQPPQDASKLEPKLRLIVEAVKRGISDEVQAELIAGIEDSGKTYKPTGVAMEAFRQMWRQLLPDFRILCLTESPAHAAMWYHYADQYRGVVLEFRCDDHADSAWLAAKPVSYPRDKPSVYTASGWAELLTLEKELALDRILDAATYTKSPDWSYENEWRITSFRRPTDTGPFTDRKFGVEELSAVYLGPNISEKYRETIIAIASSYPTLRLINVSVGMSREFEFTATGD
ncbi:MULTISPECIES: DUF2971 domain-containing protein [Methylomonas]|uniref:DUF2971 domain-containing protein n=1 Tax=Methylomonas koyamae TaxID=702114 RepID=A0A177NRM8_9GAMM|nr:DUF2971 domain-containing protein [Methylomonas koyamae]OAI20625.1 hypothetical protein A1355_23880 [Methylomonas koyamae]